MPVYCYPIYGLAYSPNSKFLYFSLSIKRVYSPRLQHVFSEINYPARIIRYDVENGIIFSLNFSCKYQYDWPSISSFGKFMTFRIKWPSIPVSRNLVSLKVRFSKDRTGIGVYNFNTKKLVVYKSKVGLLLVHPKFYGDGSAVIFVEHNPLKSSPKIKVLELSTGSMSVFYGKQNINPDKTNEIENVRLWYVFQPKVYDEVNYLFIGRLFTPGKLLDELARYLNEETSELSLRTLVYRINTNKKLSLHPMNFLLSNNNVNNKPQRQFGGIQVMDNGVIYFEYDSHLNVKTSKIFRYKNKQKNLFEIFIGNNIEFAISNSLRWVARVNITKIPGDIYGREIQNLIVLDRKRRNSKIIQLCLRCIISKIEKDCGGELSGRGRND